MTALANALLYLGALGAIGAGYYGLFVSDQARGRSLPSPLKAGVLLGALLILAAGPLDLLATLDRLLGRTDLALFNDYLRGTRHGNATALRSGLALLLLPLLLLPVRGFTRPAFVLVGTGLLATFSWTSHSAAMGGSVPLVTDLLHLIAASAWVGAVTYTAWTFGWGGAENREALLGTFRRLSGTGLLAVALLTASGVYMSLLHLTGPEVVTGTEYGRAYLVKLVLVGITLAAAAVNRFWLLPGVERGRSVSAFRALLRIESLLLVAVVIATAVLATSSLPHDADVPSPLENLRNFLPWTRN